MILILIKDLSKFSKINLTFHHIRPFSTHSIHGLILVHHHHPVPQQKNFLIQDFMGEVLSSSRTLIVTLFKSFIQHSDLSSSGLPGSRQGSPRGSPLEGNKDDDGPGAPPV